jgi:RNA-directed DNA polymerase
LSARSSPASKVRSLKNLRAAWRKVSESGHASQSSEIRKAIAEYGIDLENNLGRLQRTLAKNTFKFSLAKGVLKKRPGKVPRPIVIAPVEDRIVQRGILEVLTVDPAVSRYIQVPTSFGGLQKRGVWEAISAACYAVQEGFEFYIRSDISNFFQGIPREGVLTTIGNLVCDADFDRLMKSATDCELANIVELQAHSELFPSHEIGVAQGCCLSPLLGNVLLAEFDSKMNGRGIRCFRYIDDFILFGPSESATRKAFKSAQALLGKLKLKAYDPVSDPGKAQMGVPFRGFEFLGCQITNGRVSPNEKALGRLMDGVRKRLRESQDSWKTLKQADYHQSLIEGLWVLSKFLQAWGNHYSFCNNLQLWDRLDRQVDELIGKHLSLYGKARARLAGEDERILRRRLLGVRSLMDCNQEPIYPLKRMARSKRL